MQEQSMRDAFERHWLETRGKKKAAKELQRHTLQPQCYVQDSANRHWVTWQAACRVARLDSLEECAVFMEETEICGDAVMDELAQAIRTMKDSQ